MSARNILSGQTNRRVSKQHRLADNKIILLAVLIGLIQAAFGIYTIVDLLRVSS